MGQRDLVLKIMSVCLRGNAGVASFVVRAALFGLSLRFGFARGMVCIGSVFI